MSRPITLFLADIDGCLAEPYQPYDLDGFVQLREWAAQGDGNGRPRVGVCSGRSYAYVEAVAQALDLRGPALFESGGGLFDLPTATIRWNPALTRAIERDLDSVRAYFLDAILPRDARFSLDYGKRAQAGIVHPETAEIHAVLPEVRRFVEETFPELRVYETHVSIDIVPALLTKARAIRWLAEAEGLDLSEIAFIGDTRGDAEAIAMVGAGFAPANAAEAARSVADVVTQSAVINGVLEAYRWCLRHNATLAEATAE